MCVSGCPFAVTPRYRKLYDRDFELLESLRGNRRDKTAERMACELLHTMWKRQSYVLPSPENPVLKLFDYFFDDGEKSAHAKGGGAFSHIRLSYGSYRKSADYSARYRRFEDRVVLQVAREFRVAPPAVLAAAIRLLAEVHRHRLT